MYYVYLLHCADNTFYIGSTQNVKQRLHQHNSLKSGAKYTKMRRPVQLLYTEKYLTLSEARKREAQLKKLKRSEKEALIARSSSKR